MTRLLRALATLTVIAALALVSGSDRSSAQIYQSRGGGGGTGPAGPTGPAGATGATGATGSSGAAQLSTANTWTALQTFTGGTAGTGVMTTTVDGIGAISTDGFVLQNTTAAALGAQQKSPRWRMRGNGWGTTAGTSQATECYWELTPVQNTTAQVTTDYRCALNGAAAVTQFSIVASNTGQPSLYMGNGGGIWGGSSALSTYGFNGQGVMIGNGTPAVTSGFGTGAAVVGSGHWYAFRLNVGTGGAASTGVLTTNGSTAGTTGWNCAVLDLANAGTNRTVMTASTATTITLTSYSTTTGAVTPWVASAVLGVSCTGYL